MRYSCFFLFLMLVGCLSSSKQQEESSQIASDTVVEAKEQRYFSKNVENELLLRKAMVRIGNIPMMLIRERVIHLISGLILRCKNTLKKLIMQLSMRLIMSILW